MQQPLDSPPLSQRLNLLLTALALVISFVLLMLHQLVVGRHNVIEELNTEAAIIGVNSAAALVFNDAKAAQETIDSARLSPRITGGALYRHDGQRLAATGDGNFPSRLDGGAAGDSALAVPPVPLATSYGVLDGVFRDEIRVAGANAGTLVIHMSFVSLYWRLLEYAVGVTGIAAVALLLAYRFTRRLRQRTAKAEAELEQFAFKDQLTALPNRRMFERELRQLVERVGRDGSSAALLLIDVDDFKNINDSLGHEMGDLVLKLIGDRLTASLRSVDVVARLGGDEFGVILHGIGASDAATKVARQMIDAVNKPLPTKPTASHVGLSIGMVLIPADGRDANTLLRFADMAMYAAKAQGKNGFRFFSDEIDQRVREDLLTEGGLREALSDGGRGFSMAYQPQICALTGQLLGVEALARWCNADGRQISPVVFIRVAERTGQITELGRWGLAQVCRDLAFFRERGVRLPRVALNVSPRQLLRGESVVRIFQETLAQFGESAAMFELELTENALMEDSGAAVLGAFKAAGFMLSIDDFGTGYSSLGYLKRFHVSSLKIDQSFVRGLPQDDENAAIVSAVVKMAIALNIQVVAEGVETEAQAEFLRSCGCHILQGYLLGHPLSPIQFVDFMARRAPEPAQPAVGA